VPGFTERKRTAPAKVHEAAPVTSGKAECKLRAAVNGDEHKRDEPAQESAQPRTEKAWAQKARKWAFAAIPAIGLFELAAHVAQTHEVVSDDDWKAARDYVAAQAKREDLVTFAPRWVDPIGRMQFGPAVATLEREARPDETRFPRAFEVSIRGGHDPSLEGWKRTDSRRFGAVSVATLENPSAAVVLDDLVSMVNGERMQVFHTEGNQAAECTFSHLGPQSGGLGAGPALAPNRFVCPGNSFVTASVAADLDYHGHRCIYAPPPGHGGLRLRFLGVTLGHSLHGHHGLYVEAERDKRGAPVTLTFRVGDAVVGSVVHHDGDGWKPFEFDTTALAEAAKANGGKADIVADIESSGDRRMYCFEADTR
jgi:hypothetical protein